MLSMTEKQYLVKLDCSIYILEPITWTGISRNGVPNGGQINIGDSNNSINVDKSASSSGIVVRNTNYSVLSTNNTPIIIIDKRGLNFDKSFISITSSLKIDISNIFKERSIFIIISLSFITDYIP